MPRQVMHTPDSLKVWVDLEKKSSTEVVNIFLSTQSYGGAGTKTDHKLVKATFNLDWWS